MSMNLWGIRRHRRRTAVALALVTGATALVVVAAGCGGGSSSGETTQEETAAAVTQAETGAVAETGQPAEAATTAAAETGVAGGEDLGGAVPTLAPEIQPWYQGLTQNIEASPYGDWKSPQGPPWTIGYASTYAGNTWRAEVMKRFMDVLLPEYKAAGLVDDILVTESNYDTALQIQQMEQLVNQGADVIITCCPTPTGLNAAIDALAEKNVPFVTFDGDVTTPNGINTGVNFWLAGQQQATWLFDFIGGAGKVLNVTGIPGNNASDGFDKGVQNALANYPGIEIVDTIAGQWTDQVAKTEVLKWLATHPGEIDGVITQSAESTGVVQAFLQSGREVPPMTIGDEAGANCYWRQNPDWIDTAFHVWPPGDEGQLAFEVAVRTLAGQGPKIASITRPQIPYDYSFVEANLPEDCDVNSTGWLQPPADEWMSPETLNLFFNDGVDPLK